MASDIQELSSEGFKVEPPEIAGCHEQKDVAAQIGLPEASHDIGGAGEHGEVGMSEGLGDIGG